MNLGWGWSRYSFCKFGFLNFNKTVFVMFYNSAAIFNWVFYWDLEFFTTSIVCVYWTFASTSWFTDGELNFFLWFVCFTVVFAKCFICCLVRSKSCKTSFIFIWIWNVYWCSCRLVAVSCRCSFLFGRTLLHKLHGWSRRS